MRWVATVVLLISLSAVANAATEEIRISPLSVPEKSRTQPEIAWDKQVDKTETSPSVFVAHFKGKLRNPNWSLLYEDQLVPVTADGGFRFDVPLSGPAFRIKITLIGPLGEVIKSFYRVDFPGYAGPKPVTKVKLLGFNFLLSGSAIKYHQDLATPSDFSEIALSGKLSWEHSNTKRWSIYLSSYFTLLPITDSQDFTTRYLGFLANLGYELPSPKSWKIRLWAGAFYNTMLVANNEFGYQNMLGPDLSLTGETVMSNGNIFGTYIKYSLAINAGNWSSYELGLGASYTFHLRNGRGISPTFGLNQVNLPQPGVTINSLVIDLGCGIEF